MTDITPDFNVELKQRNATPVLAHRYSIDRLDEFLKEAYTINARIADLNAYLRAIRPSYLSTTPAPRQNRHDTQRKSKDAGQRHLTDNERASIDAEAKKLLRELNKTIRQILEAEKIRQDTNNAVALKKRAQGGFGGLARWTAGGAVTAKSVEEDLAEAKDRTLSIHREGVLLYLQKKLEEASQIQSGMMLIRLQREEEKSKSVLFKSRGQDIPYSKFDPSTLPNGSSGSSGRDTAGQDAWEEQLSQEQLQMFQEENQEMMKHYQDQLGQVRAVSRSLDEIYDLNTTLISNIELQSAQIDQLTQDSYMTTANVGRGNKELKKASERPSTARMLFHATGAFCAFLVVWDLVF